MAKAQLIPCIFCGELPCRCGEDKKTSSTRSNTTPSRIAQSTRNWSKKSSKASSPNPDPLNSASSGPVQPSEPDRQNWPPVPLLDSSSELFQTTTAARFGKRLAGQEKPETQADLEFKEVIRNLEPLMSKADKKRYKDILKPPLSASMMRRKAVIRRRHGLET